MAGINPSAIVSAIITQLQNLLTINNVHLQPTGAIAPFVTSITPPSYGPLPGNVQHVLPFEVTFSGAIEDCATRDRVFTGDIDVVIDGSVAAQKPTRITVPACKYTYAVKFVCGVQTDCGCACGPVRPGIYATEINILNPKCNEAKIVKRFVPMVFAGAVTGASLRSPPRKPPKPCSCRPAQPRWTTAAASRRHSMARCQARRCR